MSNPHSPKRVVSRRQIIAKKSPATKDVPAIPTPDKASQAPQRANSGRPGKRRRPHLAPAQAYEPMPSSDHQSGGHK